MSGDQRELLPWTTCALCGGGGQAPHGISHNGRCPGARTAHAAVPMPKDGTPVRRKPTHAPSAAQGRTAWDQGAGRAGPRCQQERGTTPERAVGETPSSVLAGSHTPMRACSTAGRPESRRPGGDTAQWSSRAPSAHSSPRMPQSPTAASRVSRPHLAAQGGGKPRDWNGGREEGRSNKGASKASGAGAFHHRDKGPTQP